MLKWPKRALAAIEKLFEPLQDVDVFVEDADDEVFYSHLLRRVTEGDARVVRVFAKHGRESVIEAASSHVPSGRRTLFLIDGDLEWVLGKPAPTLPHLFRLPAYCIENLLVSEKPALRLVVEEAALSDADAARLLDFREWVRRIEEPLVELFAAFATAREFAPTEATVSRGVSRLFTTPAPGCLPVLDESKVKAARDEALAAAISVAGETAALRVYDETLRRAMNLPFPLDVVSGKDFLLPLLDMQLRGCACKLKRKTLRLRLALHCDQERVEPLREAIRRAG